MKDKLRKIIICFFLIFLVAIFLIKFGKAFILRAYIHMVIGSCKDIPVLCVLPEEPLVKHVPDEKFLKQLVEYEFPDIKINMPEDFAVIKERIHRVYYKKKERLHFGPVAYLLYEKPNFFIGLFPSIKNKKITDDYEFIRRIMYALPNGVDNFTDAFFVIMKTVFTPDLGDGKNINIIQFTAGDKKGFLIYNLSDSGNFFDGNVFTQKKDFLKLYIKDTDSALDLNKVLAIISTIKTTF